MKLIFKLSVAIFISFLLFYLFNEKESEIRQKEFMERGQVILNVIELYKAKNGKYPDNIICCFSNLKATSKEMYIFPFDKNEELAFIYEYDWMEKDELSLMKGNNKIVSGAGGGKHSYQLMELMIIKELQEKVLFTLSLMFLKIV